MVAGIGGLLIIGFSLPLAAAPPKGKKAHATVGKHITGTTTKNQTTATDPAAKDGPATIDVLSGIRNGQLSGSAEGTGDGRMILSIRNRTNAPLRVVLPPGLIVSGTTGQFGGGMGGGMRSVPPTGLLETTLEPRQERRLPTTVVSMNGPNAQSEPLVPAEGEKLRLSGIDQWTDDTRTRAALKRLAEAKAPATVAQMVLWYVTAGASWEDIGRLSQGWGNASEIALARQFVANLGTSEASSSRTKADPGLLYWDVKTTGEKN